MDKHILDDLHERLRAIVNKASPDPLSRCLADELRIVLESLEGWDALHGLLTSAE